MTLYCGTHNWLYMQKKLSHGLNHAFFLSLFKQAYILPHTLNCVCISLFRFHIWILEQLPKTGGSAQTHKCISFIWIVWSTLNVYISGYAQDMGYKYIHWLESRIDLFMQKRSCFEIPAKMVEKLSKLFILLAIFCSLFNCINSEKTYMTEDEYETENEELSKLESSQNTVPPRIWPISCLWDLCNKGCEWYQINPQVHIS